MAIDLESMLETRRILAPVVFHTPLIFSHNLSQLTGVQVYLKLENLQRTGSFKIRGAYSRLYRLAARRPGARVVAASAGNHAQGVALSAALLGLEATIFMPRGVSLAKRAATASHGAEIRLEGQSVEEGLAAAGKLSGDPELIHPFDDELVILGQASLGLELAEDLPEMEAVLVPVGGGGLISGVAAALKAKLPAVQVIGVEPSAATSMAAALAKGEPTTIDTASTLADGARIARAGAITMEVVRRSVDRLLAVDDSHIAQAMLLLLERRRVVAEGAGALGLAALLAGMLPELKGRKVVVVVSGGNVDSNLLGRIIDQGLVRAGRIFRFSVVLPDRPGALYALLGQVAGADANVLHITHDRLGPDLPPDQSRVRLEIETRGFDHAAELQTMLDRAGYRLDPDPACDPLAGRNEVA